MHVACLMVAARMLPVIGKRRNLDFGRRPRPESGPGSQTQGAEWINPTAVAAADRAPGRVGEHSDTRRTGRFGTLMSHPRPASSLPVGSLANAVSLCPGFGPLVTTAGRALLPSPSCRATSLAAIALTAVATAAHKEHSATARLMTGPWAQRRFSLSRLHFGAHLTTIPWIADDRTDDRASSADDVAGPDAGERLRKLRFSMTDNTLRAGPATW